MTDQTSRRMALGMMGAALAMVPGARATAKALPPAIVNLQATASRVCQVTHWRARRRRGVITFSHGALSSPAKYDPFILPWVAAGYDVWAPLHVDSTDHPDTKAFPGLMSWRARIEDMRALSAHLGPGPRIAAGHSYGGLVALTMGGASADIPEGLSAPLSDPHVRAVVAFSPPGPIKGLISREGYATLTVPALIQTGDLDAPLNAQAAADAWKVHLAAYEAAAVGGERYALILRGVNHLFGGLICYPGQGGPPQAAQLRTASEVSRLFIKAYGQGSVPARRALDRRLSDTGPAILLKR